MIFTFTDIEKQIIEKLKIAIRETNFPTYIVGGFVRDRILGRNSKKCDIDIVCVGSGIELAKQMAKVLSPMPKLTVFKRFGTAMLMYKGYELEFVGARRESYRSDSRKPIVEDGTLEDDQNRRDLTINALAISLNDADFGTLLDPFNGMSDLTNKIIKTPLEAGKTFSDDPLRMLRAFRFAAQLGFEIDFQTLNAIAVNKERIGIISQERITTELNKIIESDNAAKTFDLMDKTGLLALIFPELVNLKGVDVVKGIGHKDNFYHTLEVLDNLSKKSDNLWLRWAAILHDIAKPQTKKFEEGNGWTFHGHEVLGVHMTKRIFKKFKLPLTEQLRFVQKMVRMHLRPISLTKENITDSAVRRVLFDAGDDIESLLMLCEADITSKNPNRVKRYLDNYRFVRKRMEEVEEKDQLRNWQPPISGALIMETFNLKPSKEVGIIKDKIREAILDGLIKNDKNIAFEYMVEEAAKLNLHPIQSTKVND